MLNILMSDKLLQSKCRDLMKLGGKIKKCEISTRVNIFSINM